MHSNFDACAFTCICIRYEKNIKTYKRFIYGIYGDYPFHLHGFFLPLGAHAWWFQPPMSWAWPRSHGKWRYPIHEILRMNHSRNDTWMDKSAKMTSNVGKATGSTIPEFAIFMGGFSIINTWLVYGIALLTLYAGGLNIYCCPAAIELCKSIVAFVAFGDIGAVGSGIAEALMCGECGHLPSGYLT